MGQKNENHEKRMEEKDGVCEMKAKEKSLSSGFLVRQRFLGKVGFIIFIAVMNMFIPLSIDLYLPAVPSMGEYF